eukprot:TRINITY_DN10256_c0_g1_i1.p1 TRINITY_DN10256_c0_g1~~TRINITY_DN10256_c0_g1_i1.p1  ORF type:complete len:293 (-),score=57.26 TRINITY_DN10256_c0_g1_i1:46-801(-)
MPRNRYPNILANDETRVVLKTFDNSDYINANYINIEGNKYIAAMCPLENTIKDFWNMIWDEGVALVMMIMKLKERRRVKGDKYWPSSKKQPLVFNDLRVIRESIEYHNGDEAIVKRVFKLVKNEEERTVIHYQYLEWPDFGTPSTNGLCEMVRLCQEYIEEYPNIPVLVHCSAGIGRTGTFIAVMSGISQIHEHEETDIESPNPLQLKDHGVDVQQMLTNMRAQRQGMIQTEEQYRFVHQYLWEFKFGKLG